MTRRVMFVMLLLLAATACGRGGPALPAAGSVDADKFLFDHGTEDLQRKRWTEGRLYFRTLIDSYPQSQYRQAAKLGVGDSYLGEDSIESNILAANEFREFLTFYPGHPRTDYAQYKLAVAHSQMMLGPDRDVQPARDALAATDTFLQNYPDSPLKPEVLKVRRAALNDLSGNDFKVGLYYFRIGWYPGAVERFKPLLEKDPEFPDRDGVLFYLGESYRGLKQEAVALPYYDRVVKEFEKSEYLERAQKRIVEIGTPAPATPAPGAPVPGAPASAAPSAARP